MFRRPKSEVKRRRRCWFSLSIGRPEQLEDRRLLAFAPPVTIPLASVPQSFALGDFYGDGKIDMAVAEGNAAPTQIDIFRGNGDGTFQSPVVAYNFGSQADVNSLGAADLNHDGKLDLVALVGNDDLDILFGNGDGTFQAPVIYDVSGAASMALGDVTGNGQTDIVVGGTDSHDDYTLQVLLGNSDGTFQAPITSTFGQFATPLNYVFVPTELALGDFHGDGRLDVVATNYADQRVLVSMGNGDGTFQSPVSYVTDPIPPQQQDLIAVGISAIAVGDFSHNGKLDIAATNIAAKTISVLMGNGDGTFAAPVNYQVGSEANDIITADLSGDGNLDLAFSSRLDNAVYVMDGNGDGTFQAPVKAASANGPMLMAAGDFNNDGLSDLAVMTVGYGYSGSPSSYGVSTILSEAAKPTDASSATPEAAFLTHVYQQLLGRPVEPAAFAYWNSFLQQGRSRLQLLLSVEASAEYRTDQVESLYKRYLHRAAEPAALAADSQLLAEGITDEQLAAILVSSGEYFALHGGTNDGFLTALFQDALNRPIDASSLAWFDQNLGAGGTRVEVATMLFGSHEYHTIMVSTVYQQLLDRSPNPADQAYWADQLDGGATDEQLIAVIAASEEYFDKP